MNKLKADGQLILYFRSTLTWKILTSTRKRAANVIRPSYSISFSLLHGQQKQPENQLREVARAAACLQVKLQNMKFKDTYRLKVVNVTPPGN